MKNKKVKLCAVLLFGFCLTILQAQNALFIKEKPGNITPYTLSGIKTLTFTSANMNVNKKDGGVSVYPLNNISYLNFGSPNSIVELFDNTNGKLILYPNPVINQLNIKYTTSTKETVQLRIVNLQGKVVLLQALISQQGINCAIIPVTHLQKGLYLLLLQNVNKQEISKFLKN